MAASPASLLPSLDSLAMSLGRTLASMRDAREVVEARDVVDELESVRFVSSLFPDCVVALCAFNHPGVFQPPPPSRETALSGLATRDEKAFYESLYQRVLEEDQVAIPVLYRAMQSYLREQSATIAVARLRSRLLYRRHDADGVPTWISDEKLVFETRGGKHLHVTVLRRAPRAPAPAVATLVCEQEVAGGVAHLATFTASGGAARRAGVADGAAEALTAREAEITALVARGLSTKQIAAELGLSSNTVRNCRSRILRKTGAANAAELSARWR